ncbi:MAG: NRDE family protein [Rhodospirillales bacterium]|nr:NRDE family protein [Rhodospirillales bacterium]
MCTLVILRRAEHDWPLIIAANRDEKIDRPSLPPARHWSDRMNVIAGQDQLAGGTWLGINDDGVVAGILNRTGTLGPDPSLRSRGELPLEALDHAEAEEVAAALFDLDPTAYRPFNLFVGDAKEAFWISSLNEYGEPGMRLGDIPMGVSILTDSDLNDTMSPRVMRYLPEFTNAEAPTVNDDPAADDWAAWQALLSSKEFDGEAGPHGAMNIDRGDDFATVSSSLIAIPSFKLAPVKPRWVFAAGAPDQVPYEAVQF